LRDEAAESTTDRGRPATLSNWLPTFTEIVRRELRADGGKVFFSVSMSLDGSSRPVSRD